MSIEALAVDLTASDDSGFLGEVSGARSTTQDVVHRKISHLLYCGYFRPGERVSLPQLSSALGVSETPVRSALNRLVADNAIDVLPNRYFAIPTLSKTEFEELVQLRLTLECEILHYAYLRVNRQDIRELERLNNTFVEVRSTANQMRTLETNQRFHFRLYSCAKRPMTFALIRSIWIRAGSVIGLALRSGGVQWNEDHHSDILRGLRIRDEKLCLEALSKDIRHSFEMIDRLLLDTLPTSND